jgi:4-aminobutyrate aminotransferase-like enzyme
MSMTNAFVPGQARLAEEEQAMIKRRQRLLGPGYKLFYEEPVHFVRGEGVWLYDSAGTPYLDVYNNVPSVGHCHPYVVEAMTRQAATLNVHSRYLHENILEYAEALLDKFPSELGHVMFTCTGSEANDLAYRIAKQFTGGTGFIVTDLAYHGGTDVIAAMSPSLGKHVDLGEHVRTVPAPDGYRGDAEVGKVFADHVRAAMDDLKRHGIKPAAMIVDTIFSSDGVFSDPPGFLREAVAVVQEAGALFIADEVQPGFGRTGEHWWGFQRHGIAPDMVTMGKGMGAGHPLAGLVAKPQLLGGLGQSRYFNTTGGTPVSCAVGKAVLEVIEREKMLQNAAEVGGYLRQGLQQLARRHDLVGNVRGDGLFIGVELVRDRKTRQPATEETTRLVNGLRRKRVLISSAGPFANVLKVRPPLPFTRGNADQFLQIFDDVLAGL